LRDFSAELTDLCCDEVLLLLS